MCAVLLKTRNSWILDVIEINVQDIKRATTWRQSWMVRGVKSMQKFSENSLDVSRPRRVNVVKTDLTDAIQLWGLFNWTLENPSQAQGFRTISFSLAFRPPQDRNLVFLQILYRPPHIYSSMNKALDHALDHAVFLVDCLQQDRLTCTCSYNML